MNLREWIAREGITQREAAERLGVHEITLNRWLSGRMTPRRGQIAAIETLTGGAVLWADFSPPFLTIPAQSPVTP